MFISQTICVYDLFCSCTSKKFHLRSNETNKQRINNVFKKAYKGKCKGNGGLKKIKKYCKNHLTVIQNKVTTQCDGSEVVKLLAE